MKERDSAQRRGARERRDNPAAQSGPGDAARPGAAETVRNGTREVGALVEELYAEIRERIRTEETLRNEKSYREAVENCLHVGVVAADLEGTHRHVNDAFCTITGFSRDELDGAGIPYPYWPSDARKDYAAALRKLLKGGAIPPEGFELQFVRRDGARIDVLWHVTRLTVGGTVRGYVASVHDVTARKRTESALRESEERFRSLVAHVPVGICIVLDGEIVFANPEQEKLLCTQEESAGSGPFLKVHPEDAAAFDALCRPRSPGLPAAKETDLRLLPCGPGDSAGEPRWVRCKAGHLLYQGRNAVLLTMMDITRAKELEHLMAIREKLASLGMLSAGIAHEIRNPLSGINIYLSTLEQLFERSAETDPADKARLQAIAEQMKAASSKIASVIQRVMDFSKPAPARLGAVDMNRIVEEAVRISLVALREHGVALSQKLARGLPECHADPQLIQQVLLNLINNAVQAMEGGDGPRRLEIASAAENGRIVVRVSDSGPGVPVEMRSKVFDPFFTTRKGGYGIGLSFSHRVVTEHGGSLAVRSSRWGGAEFRIELPVDPVETPE